MYIGRSRRAGPGRLSAAGRACRRVSWPWRRHFAFELGQGLVVVKVEGDVEMLCQHGAGRFSVAVELRLGLGVAFFVPLPGGFELLLERGGRPAAALQWFVIAAGAVAGFPLVGQLPELSDRRFHFCLIVVVGAVCHGGFSLCPGLRCLPGRNGTNEGAIMAPHKEVIEGTIEGGGEKKGGRATAAGADDALSSPKELFNRLIRDKSLVPANRYNDLLGQVRAEIDPLPSRASKDAQVLAWADRILAGEFADAAAHALAVVFCTYQSLPLVETAQVEGAPAFDLVVCDEAHRTTGVEEPASKGKDEQKVSPFRLIHDASRIHAHKRLYATATPRLYTESAKGKAADRNLEIYSMNDESVYGPEFYKMAFSEAIEGDWLTDYKVIILTLKADQVSEAMGNMLAAEKDSGLNLDDAVKLLGCWDALADPEGALSDRNVHGDQHNPLLRAITFTNTIKASKMVEAHWQSVVDAARERTDVALQSDLLPLAVQHVDGTQNSLDRQRKLGWLKTEDSENGQVCRVLSNARCLTEGVDVPALDAVLFLAPRKSQVDVVQAVGRVMRKAAGKEMGYIHSAGGDQP